MLRHSVLQDLRTISHQQYVYAHNTSVISYQHVRSALVTAVHRHCLQRASTETNLGTGIIDRLLLSLIVHCAKDEDQNRALGILDSALTCQWRPHSMSYHLVASIALCETDYDLPSVAATACLTVCPSSQNC